MNTRLITIIFATITALTSWAEEVEINGICYFISGNQATVTQSLMGYSGDIVIPSSVTYNDVTYIVSRIGSHAFENCTAVTSVNMGNSVISIGEFAFYRCINMESITIGNSVTRIGASAFSECYVLKSVTIPNSVTKIGDYAFFYCLSMEKLTMGNSVSTIGDQAFNYCASLTSLTIPQSVTGIGDKAFAYCYGLTSVNVEEGNVVYDSRDNCNAIIATESDSLITGCTNTIIPSSVKSIGELAFYKCKSMKSVTIPASVVTIGERAFFECSGLTSLTIPASVTNIGDRAFAYCSGITSINVEEGNVVYDSRDNCNAIIATESDSLIMGCTNTVVPESVTSIGDCAFEGCTSLTDLSVPESVIEIGNAAFACCSSLNSINMSKTILTIGSSAFYDCSILTSITIPESVTSIGTWAFMGCTGLTDVYALRTEASEYNAPNDAFYRNHTTNATLHVPTGCRESYANLAPWSNFGTITDDIETALVPVELNSNAATYYNPLGQQFKEAQRGVNIIRFSDGTTKKVLVK